MSDITPSKQPNTLNAIEKTLSVIDFISNHETTFAEIQKSLCLPKATLHRILQALELHEFIKKDDLNEIVQIIFFCYALLAATFTLLKSSAIIVRVLASYLKTSSFLLSVRGM